MPRSTVFPSSLGMLWALLRPHHWIKNGFLVAPLFFTPSAVNARSVAVVTLGVISFSALSSAVYILNDYLDRDADRAHPVKRTRPLAAGLVPVPAALTLMAALAAGGLVLAAALSPLFALVAGAYLLNNLLYSLRLKHVAIVDAFLIALGFLLRVQGGAILAGVTLSAWIMIMTGLLALFLAMAKRRDDLVKGLSGDHRRSLEGYNKPFLDAAMVVLLAAVLVAYLIYTTDQEVMARLRTDQLPLTAPFVVAGLLRYLQIVLVEERSGSPTTLLLTDRFLIAAVVGWIATFGVLLYGCHTGCWPR